MPRDLLWGTEGEEILGALIYNSWLLILFLERKHFEPDLSSTATLIDFLPRTLLLTLTPITHRHGRPSLMYCEEEEEEEEQRVEGRPC